jgi:hypothetical protein
VKDSFLEGRRRIHNGDRQSKVRTQDHVSGATTKVKGEEKMMAWPARRGVPAHHRAGCGHNKGSPVLCAEHSVKCCKGVCITAAHGCSGSRPIRDMDKV